MTANTRASYFVLLLALGGMLAATSRGERLSLSVSVLTYNTHLLPRIGEAFASHRGRGDYRAETIGRKISAYDLVGLCEVFDSRYRQTLIEAAQAASDGRFQAFWTKKPRGVGFANSGLLLLSRFPSVGDVEVLRFLDSSVREGSLSDHAAVAAIVEFQ